jgi:ssDNA-binding replication factor A large subunit
LLGDETGVMRVVCWGSKTDQLSQLKEGEIVRLTCGLCRENQGKCEIHLGDNSQLIINPNGVEIGEVQHKKPVSIRKEIKDLAENDENIEILGTVVQVFDPKFYEVCPDCGARIKDKDGEFVCLKHGKVNPDYAYVVNVFLDDGTENIRCVLFNKQAEFLFNKKKEEMDAFRTSPESFESLKTEMLGNIVKFIGRVRKNDFFDRLEFMTQLVFSEPDPEEELQRLKSEQ